MTTANFLQENLMQRTTKVFHPLSLTILTSVLLLSLAACSSINRQVKYDHAQNFESMRSYNFKPIPDKLADDTNYQLVRQANIILTIENAMAGKKIRKETRIEPDFWLNYYLTGEQPINTGDLNALFAYNLGLAWDDKYGAGQGKADTAYTYQHRTLIIDLISPDNNRLIWRGATSTGIKPGDSAADIQQALQKSAQVILKPFPPKNIFGSLKRGIPD